jgi:hypothetical protein
MEAIVILFSVGGGGSGRRAVGVGIEREIGCARSTTGGLLDCAL